MIGIVILNYINWSDTIECIRSIQASKCSNAYHIYVVDNNSPNTKDYDLHYLNTLSCVTLIWNNKNIGYSAGNNIGISKAKQAGCDAVLISNSDIRFEENSIDVMYQYLKQRHEVGIVGPKIIMKDGRIQRNNLYKKTTMKEKYLIRTKLNIFFRKLKTEYFGTDQDYEKECFVHSVSGCCFMLSSECINLLKGLDENTFLYDEELILGIQMENLMFKTVYYPKAVVKHLHGQSTKQVKPFAFSCMISSEIYYCIKYLKAKKFTIVPLYLYRSICYLGRCVGSSEFRGYLCNYMKSTHAAFQGKDINGKRWK